MMHMMHRYLQQNYQTRRSSSASVLRRPRPALRSGAAEMAAADDAFDDAVADFQCTAAGVRAQLEDMRASADLGERARLLAEAERMFDDAKVRVRELEAAVRPAPAPLKRKYAPTLQLCQKEALQLKREIVQGREWATAGSVASSGAARGPPGRRPMVRGEREQRGRLLESRGAQAETTVAINDARRSTVRSEAIGGDVLVSLRRQRDTMTRAGEAFGRANEALDRARSTLRQMARRTVTNKLITGLVILLLVVANALIIYVKFFDGRLF